jgi:hypothetical protein
MLSWFDRPRSFAISHLAGAFAAGACTSLLALASVDRSPPSSLEMRDLYVEPRWSRAGGGRLWFGPYRCVDDCSGHQAGWQWAKRNRVRRSDGCNGSGSDSFFEGCRYYLQVSGLAEDEW